MQYKLGTIQDLDEICSLVKDAIVEMEKNGIFQWDDIYPTRSDFEEDVNYHAPKGTWLPASTTTA